LQIGESVIQLLHSLLSLEGVYLDLPFMGVSLLLLFTLAMQYFDACQVEWYEHALTKSALAGVSWIWLHVPMTLYLFRLGVWLKILVTTYAAKKELEHVDSVTFSLSLALVSGLVTLIRVSNSLPDSSVALVDSMLSSEARSVLIFTFRLIVSGVQFGIGYAHIKNPFSLLCIQCALTLVTTAIDVMNDITTAGENTKQEEAKHATKVAIKSLKHFPRQWSNLQLVKKESLLEMNLMSDEGDIAASILSARGHIAEERAAAQEEENKRIGLLHPLKSSHSLININLKKLIETEITKADRAPASFDGLLLRRNSLNKSFMRTPSMLITSIMPTVKEKKEMEKSSDVMEDADDSYRDADDDPSVRVTQHQAYSESWVTASQRTPSGTPHDSVMMTSGHASNHIKSQRIAGKGPTPRSNFSKKLSGSADSNDTVPTVVQAKPASTTPERPAGFKNSSVHNKSPAKLVSDRIVPITGSFDENDVSSRRIVNEDGKNEHSPDVDSVHSVHSSRLEGMGSFTPVRKMPILDLGRIPSGPLDASMATSTSVISTSYLELSNFHDSFENESPRAALTNDTTMLEMMDAQTSSI
jgi:hypothetical protein